MSKRVFLVFALLLGIAVAGNSGAGATSACAIYVLNGGDNSVSVIDGTTNTVTTTIPVGTNPYGVAVSPSGTIYVANKDDNSVSVIDGTTNTVTATVPIGAAPYGIAVSPSGTIYPTNSGDNSVSVIDGTTNTVTATVPVGAGPLGIAATCRPPSPTVEAFVAGNGRSVEVSGQDFPPSSTVTITLGSVTLGTTSTGPDGVFNATFLAIDCAAASGTLTATAGATTAATNVTLTPCSTPVAPVAPVFTG